MEVEVVAPVVEAAEVREEDEGARAGGVAEEEAAVRSVIVLLAWSGERELTSTRLVYVHRTPTCWCCLLYRLSR